VLNSYGWSETLQQKFQTHAASGLRPARVIVQQRGLYVLATEFGDVSAQLSGRFVHEAEAGMHPVAGDWVAVGIRLDEAAATIQRLLPRNGAFVRKAAGGGRAAQVVAANVDVAFVVTSLNGDLNARRIERYLVTAWDTGACPVVVLTKADLCHDYIARRAEIEAIAPGVPVHVVSVVTGQGLEALGTSFAAGQTAALLGSSGVGKSSLVNALAGASLMATQAVRDDDARGRHTTTHRQLTLLPNGRLMLDTPGMRELGLWEADAGVATAFADVEALAAHCRFKDCAHGAEPGCAVQAAIAEGTLDQNRVRSFAKLQRELARDARKEHSIARAVARKFEKQRTKVYQARKWSDSEED
jgi:ribosome biogenesis GTPase / thiamine phosphate phosphatase